MASGLVSLVFADFNRIRRGYFPSNHRNGPDPGDVAKPAELPTLKNCYVRSDCQGHVLDHQKSYNKSSCLSRCQSNSRCKWITFDFVYHFCTQYSTCPSLGHKSCDTCITSSRECHSKTEEKTCDINGRCQVHISKNMFFLCEIEQGFLYRVILSASQF